MTEPKPRSVRDNLNITKRDIQRQYNGSALLTELLSPVTEGFEFINLDMSFSNLNMWDLMRVENAAIVVCLCDIWNLKQSKYLKSAELETILVSRRAKGGKSMNILTESVTHQKQSYIDETHKGFDFWGMGKKKNMVE